MFGIARVAKPPFLPVVVLQAHHHWRTHTPLHPHGVWDIWKIHHTISPNSPADKASKNRTIAILFVCYLKEPHAKCLCNAGVVSICCPSDSSEVRAAPRRHSPDKSLSGEFAILRISLAVAEITTNPNLVIFSHRTCSSRMHHHTMELTQPSEGGLGCVVSWGCSVQWFVYSEKCLCHLCHLCQLCHHDMEGAMACNGLSAATPTMGCRAVHYPRNGLRDCLQLP